MSFLFFLIHDGRWTYRTSYIAIWNFWSESYLTFCKLLYRFFQAFTVCQAPEIRRRFYYTKVAISHLLKAISKYALVKHWTDIERLTIIWSFRNHKMCILWSCNCFITTIWLHYVDTVEIIWPKARWEMQHAVV